MFACGDNSCGALGCPIDEKQTFASQPTKVDSGLSGVKGRVQIIAASGYASYALVGTLLLYLHGFFLYLANSDIHRWFYFLCAVLPVSDLKPRQAVSDTKSGVEESKRILPRRQSSDMMRFNRLKLDDGNDKINYNICTCLACRSHILEATYRGFLFSLVYSWGRGNRGVLGHGDTKTSSSPCTIDLFNSMRVLEVSAGLQHVLVLTEMDGVFAFGDGSHGKLGVGTCAFVKLGKHFGAMEP